MRISCTAGGPSANSACAARGSVGWDGRWGRGGMPARRRTGCWPGPGTTPSPSHCWPLGGPCTPQQRTCAARTTPYTAAPPTVARPESADSTRLPGAMGRRGGGGGQGHQCVGRRADRRRQARRASVFPARHRKASTTITGAGEESRTQGVEPADSSPTPPVMKSMLDCSLRFMTGSTDLAKTKWLPAKLAMTCVG